MLTLNFHHYFKRHPCECRRAFLNRTFGGMLSGRESMNRVEHCRVSSNEFATCSIV